MDPFDQKLADRIRDVFDNYSDDTAGHGWEELRKKYPPHQDRRPLIFWLSSAAALLLVSAGIWLAMPSVKNTEKTQVTSLNKTKQTGPAAPAGKQPAESQPAQEKAQTPVTIAKSPDAVPAHPEGDEIRPEANARISNSQPIRQAAITRETATKDHTITKEHILDEMQRKQQQVANAPLPAIRQQLPLLDQPAGKVIAGSPGQLTAKVDFPATRNFLPLAEMTNLFQFSPNLVAKRLPSSVPYPLYTIRPDSLNEVTPAVQASVLANVAVKPADSTFFNPPNTPVIAQKTAPKKSKFPFEVYAASFFSYAKGSSSQVNLSAGVSSDIPLSPNLKLSAGIGLTQNDLSFANGVPRASSSMFASAPLSDKATSVPTQNNGTAYYLKLNSYDARFVGLDIPVNLKYSFPTSRKHQLFMTAGLSSYTFIDETYTTRYSISSSSAFSTTDATQNSTVNKKFSSFDLAGTLNLSFGFGYPVNKSTRLFIEPFLKYPLQGLGTEDIHFGSGGLKLKFNFNQAK